MAKITKLSYAARLLQIKDWERMVKENHDSTKLIEWIQKAKLNLNKFYEDDQKNRQLSLEKKLIKFHNKTLEIWYNWVQTQYKLYQNTDGQYIVESMSVNWEEQKIWVVDSPAGQLEKIEQLIRFKIYDRSRNIGCINKDDENF